MKLALSNLGCSKNQVDGEYTVGWLRAAGHQLVDDFAQAEAILVNTCAFIEEAKTEAINTILEMAKWKQDGVCRLLIVCGCFSERYRAEVRSRFPEVDAWIGVHTWREDLAALFGPQPVTATGRTLTTSPHSQHLKIAEGCSRRCAFCAIPAIRGPFHSRPLDEIVAEARWLESQGTRECILVSQDTSAWGRDTGSNLVQLLEHLLKQTTIPWIRLMYLHPADIGDDLLGLVARETRVCKYLDVPMQHVSESVVRRMRRAPWGDNLRSLVGRIRERAPGTAIRSTFIVGFPGETESDFQDLLRFIEWAHLDRAGVFAYSAEEGTDAAAMKPRPRVSTAQRRCEQFMELQQEISAGVSQSRIGSVLEVIADGPGEIEGTLECRTQWDAPEVDGVVHVSGATAVPGTFVRVLVTGADAYDLQAEFV